LSLTGEVTEVGRTPHVPLVDDRARRERQKREHPDAPPRDDDHPPPPEPPPASRPGKIDILARSPALH
jgi:hypothetical protein